MYKIALCDDNKEFLELIADKIKKYGKEEDINFVLHKFNDSDILMEWVESKQLFDVYFLDIEMPCYTGIDLAKNIRKYSDSAFIVFLTAHENFAVEACGINVIRYLLKNRMDNEIKELLNELVVRLMHMHDDNIYLIANQRRYVKLRQRDIIYAYKNQKNTVFVMKDGSEEKDRVSLQEAFEKMNNKDMIWLDRGVILNIHHILQIKGENVKMDGGYEITTGASHIAELKKILCEYWGDFL